ncbi:hypothetical protein EDB19DRAFT_1840226 [Suillus lakei]|nr:hypothetical protein EDB19DRAFT_1840226 [Suillus lakei]
MPKQHKSVLQKQYRNKELDGFSLVRTEIRHATGGEIDPKTRQDVLRKAARLIKELSVLNKKLQHQLYKSRPGSETPSYVGGLPTTISSPCTQGPYFPVLYEYFIEQPNSVCQLAGIPPTELHSFVPRTGYELCDANMSLGNMGTTPANGQVISQLIPAMVKCYGSNYKVNRMWILRLCHEAGCVSDFRYLDVFALSEKLTVRWLDVYAFTVQHWSVNFARSASATAHAPRSDSPPVQTERPQKPQVRDRSRSIKPSLKLGQVALHRAVVADDGSRTPQLGFKAENTLSSRLGESRRHRDCKFLDCAELHLLLSLRAL